MQGCESQDAPTEDLCLIDFLRVPGHAGDAGMATHVGFPTGGPMSVVFDGELECRECDVESPFAGVVEDVLFHVGDADGFQVELEAIEARTHIGSGAAVVVTSWV